MYFVIVNICNFDVILSCCISLLCSKGFMDLMHKLSILIGLSFIEMSFVHFEVVLGTKEAKTPVQVR